MSPAPQLKACIELAHRGFRGGSAGEESTCSAGDLGWEDPLEKGKATRSSIPAWRIPWTEESGGAAKSWIRQRSALGFLWRE